MSAYYGRMGKGARAHLRQAKRDEALARNAATPPERKASARRPLPAGQEEKTDG